MTEQRVIKKHLAGEEDLLYGEGEVTQNRGGLDYTLTKNRTIYPVNSEAELATLDTDRFVKAALFDVAAGSVTFYVYNTATEAWDVNGGANVVDGGFKTLTSGQTVVTFLSGTRGVTFYIVGPDTDSKRLIETVHYTVNHSINTVTLLESYPAGTMLLRS